MPEKKSEKINFSVPTGNFGDVYAGYVAKKMGLPINKLIIATVEPALEVYNLTSGKLLWKWRKVGGLDRVFTRGTTTGDGRCTWSS